jgi:small nuclear ribonucleoprotein E
MVQPINVIFRYLQQQTKVSLWLYDNVDFRIEGRIIVSRWAQLTRMQP